MASAGVAGRSELIWYPDRSSILNVAMKYLLILLAVFVVVWAVRKSQRERKAGSVQSRPARPGEDMVRCPVCGVNLPLSEAVKTPHGTFCSPGHAAEHSDTQR